MNFRSRTLPLVGVIAVSALSGAFASAVVERAAVAATPAPLDPRLTTLLNAIKVDDAGDVTIKGLNVSVQGTTVKINAQTTTLEGTQTTVQGSATAIIKGAIVKIN